MQAAALLERALGALRRFQGVPECDARNLAALRWPSRGRAGSEAQKRSPGAGRPIATARTGLERLPHDGMRTMTSKLRLCAERSRCRLRGFANGSRKDRRWADVPRRS